MLANLVKSITKYTSLLRWEYVDQQFEVYKKKRRIPFIEQVLPKGGIGAELGVFKGHLSPILLKSTKAKKLHLIDPWYLHTSHWHWAGGNQSTVDALIHVLKKMKKDIEKDRVLVHVGHDTQVLATFPDHYFDWVYLDTSHSYEHTRSELRILTTKLEEEGIISGDDWQPDPGHKHHGVCKAVMEFVESDNYKLIYANRNDRQWAIKRSKRGSPPARS